MKHRDLHKIQSSIEMMNAYRERVLPKEKKNMFFDDINFPT